MIRTAGEETTNTHHIMKKSFLKNTNYTSPEVELLVVRGGEMICTSPVYGSEGAAGSSQEYNDYNTDF